MEDYEVEIARVQIGQIKDEYWEKSEDELEIGKETIKDFTNHLLSNGLTVEQLEYILRCNGFDVEFNYVKPDEFTLKKAEKEHQKMREHLHKFRF